MKNAENALEGVSGSNEHWVLVLETQRCCTFAARRIVL